MSSSLSSTPEPRSTPGHKHRAAFALCAAALLLVAFVVGALIGHGERILAGMTAVLLLLFLACGALLGTLLAKCLDKPSDGPDESSANLPAAWPVLRADCDRQIQFYLRRTYHEFGPAGSEPAAPSRRGPAGDRRPVGKGLHVTDQA